MLYSQQFAYAVLHPSQRLLTSKDLQEAEEMPCSSAACCPASSHKHIPCSSSGRAWLGMGLLFCPKCIQAVFAAVQSQQTADLPGPPQG